jgi:hypothetical protein
MNERIESLNVDFALVTESMALVCECGDIACAEQFTMSLPDYKALRNESTHFAVKPGHEVADVEDVVRKTDVFWVVRKRPGGPAEIAEALDPRSP